MIALALLLAGQSAAVPLVTDTPTRFSILADPCSRSGTTPTGQDIVVCGRSADTRRLPLPDERGPPDHPMPSNPNLDGKGALVASAKPCATAIGGCQVGVDILGAGTTIVRGLQKLISPNSCCEAPGEATNPGMLVADTVGGVKRMFRRKPDKSNRVAIPLDDPAPPSAQ